MRIGEVAAVTGVPPATLRAWERRYEVLRPARTEGGHRIYGANDVARVRAIVALVDAGYRVSDAARRLSAPTIDQPAHIAQMSVDHLWGAIDAFDEPAARAGLREITDVLGIPDALDLVFVPTLRRLGAEWRLTPRNIAREHFASTLLRSHLVELLPTGHGPPTCFAFCPEGERHDLGLIMAALALGSAGWHPIVLGADTPSTSIEILIEEIRPSLVLIAASARPPASRFLDRWSPPRGCTVIAGGHGFRTGDQPRVGGHVHTGPYTALPAIATASLQGSPLMPSDTPTEALTPSDRSARRRLPTRASRERSPVAGAPPKDGVRRRQ
jgi:DNA-binding transcriptional MerR regulator